MPKIISTPADMRPHLPVAYGNTLKSLPDFGIAEEQNLIPIIGQELYEGIQAESLSDELIQLRDKCRAVIAPFAYVLHLPFLQVLLSDNGLLALEAENNRKAFKWEYREVIEALANMGFIAQERLISFLSIHKEDYPDWVNADYNNTKNFAFIRNGKELGESIAIVQPHRSFMHLRALFTEVGELDLRSLLGDEYYDALSQRVRENSVTDASEKNVVLNLQLASARLVMAKAAEQANVRFNAGSGFTIADVLKDQPDQDRKSPQAAQLSSFAESQRKTAMAFLDKAKEVLNNKASETVAPEYFGSDKYSNPHSAGEKLNVNRSGIFPMS